MKNLNLAILCERIHGVVGDDKMIQDANVDQRQCRFECLRKTEICLTGFGGARGMVMRQNDAGCVVCQCALDYFAWINASVT